MMTALEVFRLRRRMRTEYVRMGDAPVRYFGEWRILVNKTLSGKFQVRIQRGEEGQCWSGMDATQAGAFEVALAGLAAELRGRPPREKR